MKEPRVRLEEEGRQGDAEPEEDLERVGNVMDLLESGPG